MQILNGNFTFYKQNGTRTPDLDNKIIHFFCSNSYFQISIFLVQRRFLFTLNCPAFYDEFSSTSHYKSEEYLVLTDSEAFKEYFFRFINAVALYDPLSKSTCIVV